MFIVNAPFRYTDGAEISSKKVYARILKSAILAKSHLKLPNLNLILFKTKLSTFFQ